MSARRKCDRWRILKEREVLDAFWNASQGDSTRLFHEYYQKPGSVWFSVADALFKEPTLNDRLWLHMIWKNNNHGIKKQFLEREREKNTENSDEEQSEESADELVEDMDTETYGKTDHVIIQSTTEDVKPAMNVMLSICKTSITLKVVNELLKGAENGKLDDVVMTVPPVKPAGGDVILYKCNSANDLGYYQDGYVWRYMGKTHCDRNKDVTQKYYHLLMGHGNSRPTTKQFKRNVYFLNNPVDPDMPFVLLHYIGDEAIFKQSKHKRATNAQNLSVSSRYTESDSIDNILRRIKNIQPKRAKVNLKRQHISTTANSINKVLMNRKDKITFDEGKQILMAAEGGYHDDMLMKIPPVKPISGDIILYKCKSADDKDYKHDQYKWHEVAITQKKGCTQMYYHLEDSPTLFFKRCIFSLYDHKNPETPIVLLNYFGDGKYDVKPGQRKASTKSRIKNVAESVKIDTSLIAHASTSYNPEDDVPVVKKPAVLILQPFVDGNQNEIFTKRPTKLSFEEAELILLEAEKGTFDAIVMKKSFNKPAGGDVILYKRKYADDTEYLFDGYKWCNVGMKMSVNQVVIERYYHLRGLQGKVAGFKRNIFILSCPVDTKSPYVLIHYMGDEALFNQFSVRRAVKHIPGLLEINSNLITDANQNKIFMRNLKKLTYAEAKQILTLIEKGELDDLVMTTPPVQPVGGDVIAYRCMAKDDASYRDDQYMWRNLGLKRSTDKEVIERYYHLLGKEGTLKGFKKNTFHLDKNLNPKAPIVLIHYTGDASLFEDCGKVKRPQSERSTNGNRMRLNKILCAHDNCECGFLHLMEYRNHLEDKHGVVLLSEHLKFPDLKCFRDWLSWEQSNSYSGFVIDGVSRKGTGIRHFYKCRRSGCNRTPAKGIRNGWKMGSGKMGCHCPASITAVEKDTGVHVAYYKTHFGHTGSLSRCKLSKRVREDVKGMLLKGMSTPRILNSIRLSTTSFSRDQMITSKDVSNIRKANNIPTLPRQVNLGNEDDVSVKLWVEEMKQSESNPVLLFKEDGVEMEGLEMSDFMLITMSTSQQDAYKLFSRDGVHVEVNKVLDKHLITLFVSDQYAEGFPAAFCVTSCLTISVLTIFFQQIKFALELDVTPKYFMCADNMWIHKVWCEVFGNTHRIIPAWYVMKTCGDTLPKWKKDLYQSVMESLKLCIAEKDVTVFNKLLGTLMMDSSRHPELREFFKYFRSTYARSVDQWANCYIYDFDTNINIDSHNNSLTIGNVRKGKNMESLLMFLIDKPVQHMTRLQMLEGKGQLSAAAVDRRHTDGALLVSHCQKSDTGDKWFVHDVGSVIYEVSKMMSPHECQSDCVWWCQKCQSCLKTLCCTCSDYTLFTNVCKHIHAVCLLGKEYDVDICEEYIVINEMTDVTECSNDVDGSEEVWVNPDIHMTNFECIYQKAQDIAAIVNCQSDSFEINIDTVENISQRLDSIINTLQPLEKVQKQMEQLTQILQEQKNILKDDNSLSHSLSQCFDDIRLLLTPEAVEVDECDDSITVQQEDDINYTEGISCMQEDIDLVNETVPMETEEDVKYSTFTTVEDGNTYHVHSDIAHAGTQDNMVLECDPNFVVYYVEA